jgi:hypothetical protein
MVRQCFPKSRQCWLLRLMLVLSVSATGVWLAWTLAEPSRTHQHR